MKQQIQLLLTAFGFFTRIPVPKNLAFSQSNLNRCNRYLPLVGYVVGAVGAVVVYLAAMIFPWPIAVVLSMISTILLTGAFHEDGLADVCDAFGGGWTKEKILTIMKDSRLGAYGAIGILLALLLKFSCLFSMSIEIAAKAIITAHVISRFFASWTMHSLPYVREDESSKSKPITKDLDSKDLLIGLIFTATSFILWQNWIILCVVIPLIAGKYLLERYFRKWIGGYTGDCLGTMQQISELIVYLFIVATMR